MLSPLFESSYRYTPALVRALIKRQLMSKYAELLILLAVVCVFAVFLLREPGYRWLSGFLLGIVFAIIVMLVKWYRRTMALAAAYAGNLISIRIFADGIEMASPILASTVPWRGVAAIERVPEGLVLRRKGSSTTTTLPSEALSPQSIAFILSSVEAAGGQVV